MIKSKTFKSGKKGFAHRKRIMRKKNGKIGTQKEFQTKKEDVLCILWQAPIVKIDLEF